jgi:hypothetical protein
LLDATRELVVACPIEGLIGQHKASQKAGKVLVRRLP